MADHYQPRSKGTWGREEEKTAAELNRLCNAFFDNLVVPKEWKFLNWSNAIDNPSASIVPLQGDNANKGVLLSVGKAFRDMRTSGIDLMHYRIYFNSFSHRGGVCEISMKDFGKYAYKVVGHGIFTIEELNAFIANRYNELKQDVVPDEKEQPTDNSDGLQHFRDRFNDTPVTV